MSIIMSSLSYNDKVVLRNRIQELSNNDTMQILNIIKRHNINNTEKSKGVYISMNDIPDSALVEINEFIDKVSTKDSNHKTFAQIARERIDKLYCVDTNGKPTVDMLTVRSKGRRYQQQIDALVDSDDETPLTEVLNVAIATEDCEEGEGVDVEVAEGVKEDVEVTEGVKEDVEVTEGVKEDVEVTECVIGIAQLNCS
jgi:hypothetical protein